MKTIFDIKELEVLFSSFLEIDINSISRFQKVNNFCLPKHLSLLYAIKEEYNSIKPSNSLFAMQDSLIPFADLKVENNYLDFLEENQWGWICCLDSEGKMYIRNDKEDRNYNLIMHSASDVLTSYALMELTYLLPELANEETDILDGYHLEDIKELFGEVQDLCLNIPYVYPTDLFSFYKVDSDSLFFTIKSGSYFNSFFATTSVEKYNSDNE